jgi:DNA-binding CsgD family transcriptional regulator
MTVKLSEQEKNALKLFKDGKSIQEISLLVGLSYQGAANLMNDILAKTGSDDKQSLLNNAELYLSDTQN